MLFGSVPSPPKMPMSSTSTQSARHSATKAARAGRVSAGRPMMNATAMTPSTATTNRLTAKPCRPVNEPKPDTRSAMNRGWDVWAIACTIPARVPGSRPEIPCQNPRPGQACRTAIPARNAPNPASTARPSRGVRQLRSGSATRAPAAQYASAAPGAPNSQVNPGAKIPPKDSPNTQTTSPQPALASPASRDAAPRGAASSHSPIPAWIHTVAAPAWIGWYDHVVPAQFTRCCTQAGELDAVGSITRDGSPAAIPGCA